MTKEIVSLIQRSKATVKIIFVILYFPVYYFMHQEFLSYISWSVSYLLKKDNDQHKIIEEEILIY